MTDLTEVTVKETPCKMPHMVKRNARYRGPRESEKYLFDHQEELYDIRQNYLDIHRTTETQRAEIASWFHGNSQDPVENITFSGEKSFNVNLNQRSYPLISKVSRSQFSILVVQLNGNVLPENSYTIDNGFLVLNSNALQEGSLKVQYTVTIPIKAQRMVGLNENHRRLQSLSDRIGAIERRYQSYENAYE